KCHITNESAAMPFGITVPAALSGPKISLLRVAAIPDESGIDIVVLIVATLICPTRRRVESTQRKRVTRFVILFFYLRVLKIYPQFLSQAGRPE
ncbi:hypothetical protein, partial [Tanticharoenia sakaeratensis]